MKVTAKKEENYAEACEGAPVPCSIMSVEDDLRQQLNDALLRAEKAEKALKEANGAMERLAQQGMEAQARMAGLQNEVRVQERIRRDDNLSNAELIIKQGDLIRQLQAQVQGTVV